MARGILIIWCLWSSLAFADDSALILGRWHFTSVRYQDKEGPLPNPDLDLVFQFNNDGTDSLSWTRKNIPGGCERRASYQWSNQTLVEMVMWVNPANLPECLSDPDMQMGKSAQAALRLANNRLELDVAVSDQKITYLFTKEAPPPPKAPLGD